MCILLAGTYIIYRGAWDWWPILEQTVTNIMNFLLAFTSSWSIMSVCSMYAYAYVSPVEKETKWEWHFLFLNSSITSHVKLSFFCLIVFLYVGWLVCECFMSFSQLWFTGRAILSILRKYMHTTGIRYGNESAKYSFWQRKRE